MAINRISDLSILHSSDVIKDGQLDQNFKDSFVEVSYRVDDPDSQFKMKSMAMQVDGFVDSCTAAVFQKPRDIHISGSVYANENGEYAGKIANLNFEEFRLSTDSKAVFDGGIEISPSGTVNTTTANDNSIVNVKYLNDTIANTIQSIKSELSDYITRVMGEKLAQYAVEMPILSYVYSDHDLTGLEQWKKAGDTVILSDYPALSSHYEDNKSNMRILPSGVNPPPEDTWYYKEIKSGNDVTAIVLPKTEWFIQPAGSILTSEQFVTERLPQLSASVVHSHKFSNYAVSATCAAGDDISCVSSFMQTGVTAPYTGEIIVGNSIYNGEHVQPYSTRAMLYFYVGPKNGREIATISVDYDKVWPVGSVYITTGDAAICPLESLMLGSQWQRITGRYLLASGALTGGAADESYEPGKNVNAGLPDISITESSTYKFSTGYYGCGCCGAVLNAKADQKIELAKSSIYGKSKTVRPPAIALAVWKRIK